MLNRLRSLLRKGDGETSRFDRPASWLLNALGGSPTATGLRVTPDSALQASAVWACVQVLSQDVAKLPLMLYRRMADGGRTPAVEHPLYPLLVRRPNPWHTRYELSEMIQLALLLRGNAYIAKLYDARGRIRALVPVHPDRVTVLEAPDGELVYQLARGNLHEQAQLDGLPLAVTAQHMCHVRGLSLNGVTGVSVLTYARESVGLALATEQHGAKLFGNGARPGGILQHPGKLSDEAHARLKSSWSDAHSGVANAWKTAILEEGMKWEALGMTSEDSQYLQTRQHQVLEIARFFRVPPHKIQDLSRATHSNIEHQALEYVTDSLMPWLERREAAFEAWLLTDAEQEDYLIEHDVSRLLRGDILSRYRAYAIGRQWGWKSANDIRLAEGDNPIEGGDVYLSPLNMVPAGTELDDPDKRTTGDSL